MISSAPARSSTLTDAPTASHLPLSRTSGSPFRSTTRATAAGTAWAQTAPSRAAAEQPVLPLPVVVHAEHHEVVARLPQRGV